MLGDLKVVEDKLYQPEALDGFLQKHSVHDLIRLLNKATKKQTRDRIRYCFSKVSSSHRYRDLLCACLDDNAQRKKEFAKFVASEHSEEFYSLLQNKPEDVLQIMDQNQTMTSILMKLIGFEHGIKLVRMFSKIYRTEAEKYQCLFHPLIQEGLSEGLGYVQGQKQVREDVDTVAQMRYLEIIVNVSVLGGKCYQLVSELLQKALLLYKTQDILLKMAMVQVISGLGQGVETSQLLKDHAIWKFIQKDACDPNQELYVKKFLLVLMIDMSNNGHYDLNQKVVKNIHQFLIQGLKSKGEELDAAIDIIAHLFRSSQGIKIVVQNMDLLSTYVSLSRSTKDSIKKPYYQSLVNLTSTGCSTSKEAKNHPKYKLAINLLNCVGKPNLVAELSHNLHANNYMIYGLDDFSQWFSALLQLPFQESEILLVQIFQNILNFYQVAQSLLQVQDTTKYLLRQLAPTDTNKTLREAKGVLIGSILQKGKSDWQGLQLSEYSRNLQKMLQNSKKESMYALDVE